MDPVIAVACFALGTVMASFMGVVAARLYTGESLVRGRSKCDACAMALPPLSLIPIVSYLFQGGKAKCCGARISLASPASEALLGMLFVLSYAKLGFTPALPFTLAALSLLAALVLYDLAHQILPPALLYGFVLIAAIAGYLSDPLGFPFTIFVALGIGGSLALINLLSRGRAMGLADAPLAFGLSLMAGTAAFPGFLFSFWIGAVIGIFILLGRAPGSRMGIEVPFAPFLAAGFILAYFTQWNPFAFAALLSP